MKIKALVDYSALNFQDPIPQHIRARVPSLIKVDDDFREKEKISRRDCLDSSVESIFEQHTQYRRSGRPLQEINKTFEKKIEERLDTRIQLSIVHFNQRDEDLKQLVNNRSALKEHQFKLAKNNLEGQIRQIALELVGLRRHKNEIKGRIVDLGNQYSRITDNDITVDHLMNSLIATFKDAPAAHNVNPAILQKGKRKTSYQSNFRKSLVRYYAAEPPTDIENTSDNDDEPPTDIENTSDDDGEPLGNKVKTRSIWCPISKRYQSGESIRAAHIVPHSIGEANCSYLFTEAEAEIGHLMSPKNGILIHYFFEQAMDKAQFAIVPADSEDPSSALKIIVLDRGLLKRKIAGFDFDWKTLDGLRLGFKNENRPGLRYLYFNFLLSLFRRRRFECDG